MDWSFQLYSARNFQPWDEVLAMLARQGYRQVEGYPGIYADPEGLIPYSQKKSLDILRRYNDTGKAASTPRA